MLLLCNRLDRVVGIACVLWLALGPAGCRRPNLDANRALLDAAKSGNVAGVRTALEAGADVDARNESHRTVLMLAALKGQAAVVKELMNRGADVNARDGDGMTALMWAAFGGSPDVVQALLKRGADPSARSNRGETALDWAGSSPGPHKYQVEKLFKQPEGGG